MNFKIVFHLDGSGILFDQNEPIHLDALLTWALAPRIGVPHDLARDERPRPVPIPLHKFNCGEEQWVFQGSALFPEGPIGEDLQYWRKRFRQGCAELSTGSPNLTNGPYRDWNMPIQPVLATRMVAYASGSRNDCRKLLKGIRFLGKKASQGYGKVIGLDCEDMGGDDRSIVHDGCAMRWLPAKNGFRRVRLRPPYWNIVDRVTCCEVGDPYVCLSGG